MSENTLRWSDVDAVLERLRELSVEVGENAVRSDYGGRGALGGKCLGFTVRRWDAPHLVGALFHVLGDRVNELFSDTQGDDIGRDVVFYFPHWKIED